ncbi:MAG: hypothetical protein NVS4B3_11970 [Gemmatimonadaceae bacterium]
MEPARSAIVALVLPGEPQARVTAALADRADLRFCETGREVLELMHTAPAGTVILELRDRAGFSTAPVIRTLRAEYPSTPVLIYCSTSRPDARDMLLAARAGASDVILRGVDDEVMALRSCLVRAIDDSVRDLVARELRGVVPMSIAPFLEYCFDNVRRATSVRAAASALGVHRKTLVNRLAVARLPPPNVIASWARLLVAARLLEDPGRSAERVALELGFPSASAFRNVLKRRTSLRPAQVRAAGGLAGLLPLFKAQIEALARRRPATADE